MISLLHINYVFLPLNLFRNRFKTYEVCMDYCDDVMKTERDKSPDPNGDSETTNAMAPDSGRFV